VPFFLRLFTYGIEYHHIHHFSMRVAGYNIQRCHDEAPAGLWDEVNVLGPLRCFKGLYNVMYNEETERYEPYAHHKVWLNALMPNVVV
jgi:omega-6 fatty acid desaturase (delta-12 desaturase)